MRRPRLRRPHLPASRLRPTIRSPLSGAREAPLSPRERTPCRRTEPGPGAVTCVDGRRSTSPAMPTGRRAARPPASASWTRPARCSPSAASSAARWRTSASAPGSTRGVYSNFNDKDDVLDALVVREHTRLLAHLDATFVEVDREVEEADSLEAVLSGMVDPILRSIPVDRQLSLIQTELEIFGSAARPCPPVPGDEQPLSGADRRPHRRGDAALRPGARSWTRRSSRMPSWPSRSGASAAPSCRWRRGPGRHGQRGAAGAPPGPLGPVEA